ncbi:MAG TPA: phosphopantetheine-binding protein [Frankiaceae bacterium]|nr:phosphopantetheine-binding protein [Frankiaceae bacterium]
MITSDRAFEAVRDAVVVVMEVAPESVTRDTRLVTELRCDSIALVEIAEIVEEALPGLAIEDAALDDIDTVGQAVDYIVSRG